MQATLDKAGFPLQVELLYIGGSFENIPRGRIEVWLPPLSQVEGKSNSSLQRDDLRKRLR